MVPPSILVLLGETSEYKLGGYVKMRPYRVRVDLVSCGPKQQVEALSENGDGSDTVKAATS